MKKKAFATESAVGTINENVNKLDAKLTELKAFTGKGINNVTSEGIQCVNFSFLSSSLPLRCGFVL